MSGCGTLNKVFASHIDMHKLMHTGTLLQDMSFKCPTAVLFLNQSPVFVIVACRDDIFIVDLSTHSTHPFSGTPNDSFYHPHALSLFDDDSVLLACSNNEYGECRVSGYDTASRTRLWIHDTVHQVGTVCLLGTHVLLPVYDSSTLVLQCKSGAHIVSLKESVGFIYGLGVIEGSCFILS
jgi:hypothetical protein